MPVNPPPLLFFSLAIIIFLLWKHSVYHRFERSI